MTAPGRLAAILVAVAVSVALLFARTPAVPDRPPATASFSASGVSFRYPATWRSGTWNEVVSFNVPIVYLSTGPQHNPCTVTRSPGMTSVDCTEPVGPLRPGGVLVRWDASGFPGRHLPKPNTAIAGRPAVETKTTGGWCASLGATETITVMITRGTPDSWYQMDACLRAPNLPHQEAQLAAMLSTVRIAASD